MRVVHGISMDPRCRWRRDRDHRDERRHGRGRPNRPDGRAAADGGDQNGASQGRGRTTRPRSRADRTGSAPCVRRPGWAAVHVAQAPNTEPARWAAGCDVRSRRLGRELSGVDPRNGDPSSARGRSARTSGGHGRGSCRVRACARVARPAPDGVRTVATVRSSLDEEQAAISAPARSRRAERRGRLGPRPARLSAAYLIATRPSALPSR